MEEGSREAIDALTQDQAKTTYRSIKNKENIIWSSIEEAEKAFATKCDLNEQIEELEDEIENDDNASGLGVLRADLDNLLSQPKAIQLIIDLEKGFGVTPGSFARISDSMVNMDAIKITKKTEEDTTAVDEKEQIKANNHVPETKSQSAATTMMCSAAKMIAKAQRAKNVVKERNDQNKGNVQDSDVDSDVATYQKFVYGNDQIALAKERKKKRKKKKQKPKPKKYDENMGDDDLDDDFSVILSFETKKEHKVWDHSHEQAPKFIRADSRKEDRRQAKIKKANAEIKKLKRERKKSNANCLKKRNSSRSSQQFKNNSHETTVKFVGDASLKQKQRDDKIKKSRQKIKEIKKRNKDRKKAAKPKRTYSFKHAHEQ